jgi:hypothetical protein
MIKDLMPVIAAGGAFTGCALVGLLVGIFVASRSGSQGWVFGGLLVGIGLGGYAAFRAFQRSE